ncbi:MAG: hypothetical protein RR598_10900 [Anaerorhabdus sp.]
MKCSSDVWGEKEVEPIDEVYRSIQFDAKFMDIGDNGVKLYYPCSSTKKEWLYWIDGKPYTSVGTNVFVDDFDKLIKSNNILHSWLQCYRNGWTKELCRVRGEICVYEIDKYKKVTVYINRDMHDGSAQISVGYDDKKTIYGSGGCHLSKRGVIKSLNYIFDNYDTRENSNAAINLPIYKNEQLQLNI